VPLRGGLGLQRRAEAVCGIANRRVSGVISDSRSGRMVTWTGYLGLSEVVFLSPFFGFLETLSLTRDDIGNIIMAVKRVASWRRFSGILNC